MQLPIPKDQSSCQFQPQWKHRFSANMCKGKGWSAAAKWMWNILSGVVPKRLQVRFPAHSYLLLRKTHKLCLGHTSSADSTSFRRPSLLFQRSITLRDTSTVGLSIVFVSNCRRNMRWNNTENAEILEACPQSWATNSRWPCLSQEQTTSSSSFQLQPLCDPVTE